MTALSEPTNLDRGMRAFRALVSSVFPAARYWIVHEYTVHESDGMTFSGLPTDAEFSPQLPTRVPYSPALAGSYSVVPQGTLAYVGFANADPSKPYLVRFGSTLPTSTVIDVAAGSVVTVGDPTHTTNAVACVGNTASLGTLTAMAGVTPVTFTWTFPSAAPVVWTGVVGAPAILSKIINGCQKLKAE